MARTDVVVSVVLDGGDGSQADRDDLDGLTLDLRRELLDAGAVQVAPVPGGPVPDGARGVE